MLQTAVDPVRWVRTHVLPEGGVCVSSRRRVACPAASASLLLPLHARGEAELAHAIASWLPLAQRADGSFAGDTPSVVRGLALALPHHPSVEPVLRRACDWLMSADPTVPSLAAMRTAGVGLGETRYVDFAGRALAQWLERRPPNDFGIGEMPSRDFAAVQSSLCELGQHDRATAGLRSLAAFQQAGGAVPASSDVVWVCTLGQLQAAIAFAKVGERERAEQALRFLEPFVLPSQGLFGSFGPGADLAVDEELAAAAALWLDAEDALAAHAAPTPTYDHNLSAEDWHDSIAGTARAEGIAASVRTGDVPRWVQPVLDATAPGQSLLELGSGTGALSAALAHAGRHCALLDFSRESLALGAAVFGQLALAGRFCEADVLSALPFADRSFDCVWSSGLLEHFDDDRIDHIVAESARLARRAVIALVPNAGSIPYRLGKFAQERAGTWPWGREDPKQSLRATFERAGLDRIREWTIAPHHALEFVEDPGLRGAFTAFYDSLSADELTELGQGYLLVTVGEPAGLRQGGGSCRA